MTWNAAAERRHEITAEDEINIIRSEIDRMIQIADTAEQWMEINRLCRTIGDQPPIVTEHPHFLWHAHRADRSWGDPEGHGATKFEAITDLLDKEDAAST